MTASGTFIRADDAVALLAPLTDLVAQASRAILAIDRGSVDVTGKHDGSPVTEADLTSDTIIAEGIARLMSGVPLLSEERVHEARAPFRSTIVIVDPLDGTKEFIAGRDEFTVNLAVVTDGTPLLGIVAAPALGLVWRGVVGRGAERLDLRAPTNAETIRTRAMPPKGEPWIVTVSRSHGDEATDAFIARRPGATRLKAGSAVKFCRVAEGNADIYPRLAPTGEWDVAAGHALVTAAGGKITDGSGNAVRFGQTPEKFLVPHFIAWGDPSVAE